MYRLYFCLILALCTRPALSAQGLSLHWELISNGLRGFEDTHRARFTLVNSGTQALGDSGWALYWNQAPHGITAQGTVTGLQVRWINGDFYEMRPLPGFTLLPGDSAVHEIVFSGFAIKTTDGPLGVYWVDDKGVPHAMDHVAMVPFLRREQFRRGPLDQEPDPDPGYLYRQGEKLSLPTPETVYPFLPVPRQFERGQGIFKVDRPTSVAFDPSFESEFRHLQGSWPGSLQIRSKAAKVRLLKDPGVSGAEAYAISVTPSGVELRASGNAGMFYAVTTLLALVENAAIPACEIADAPAYPYRGMHVDVARNFQSVPAIYRLIDQMAAFKLNKLLLYLTEDEAWRIEIPQFPELTRVGARRGHSPDEDNFLQPAYGSGYNPDDPSSPGNGFYSRGDFIGILRYAAARHIEVIPEVNFPAHARAAIVAMESRYRRLMAEGNPKEAERYRLIDPGDRSEYLSAQSYTDNVVCACRPSVLDFYREVLDAFVGMYREAGLELKTFHTGGDEVPNKAWSLSPVCKAYLEANPHIGHVRNLHKDLLRRMLALLAERRIIAGGWEEVAFEYDADGKAAVHADFAGKGLIPYIWNNLWGQQDLGYRIANRGYPIVLCPVTNLYFDLAYSNDPREPGLYWAGFVDEQAAFSLLPEDLFLSTRFSDMGMPFVPERDFKGMERLSEKGRANILGLQGQLWGETIKGMEMLEYYYLPKMLGLAQRAWQGMPAWAAIPDPTKREMARLLDYGAFLHQVVQREFKRMDAARPAFHYRIPPPGILQRGDTLLMNSTYPGMTIKYTLDGSTPNWESKTYNGPIRGRFPHVRARIFNAKGRSGLESQIYTPQ